MLLFPNAKINLGLYITEKRKDGYHNLITCMIPIPLTDALEIIPADKTSFKNTGILIPGNEKDNLILKALKLLRKDFNDLPNIQIHLHKTIPMGAGLGGGSADGAFAISMMNSMFDLHLEDWFLEDYAAELGSDCPFFIENKPKIATGRGEILEDLSIDLSDCHLVLINPAIHIGTKEAYAGVSPAAPTYDIRETLADRKLWKERLSNDFETSIFPKHPEIAEVKEQLYTSGAFYASMSGSGSTVFGLFDHAPKLLDYPEHYFTYSAPLEVKS
ncbi:4-diphosphocytidyl-2-C-methyl-D-erythritol kinase [Echinicola pacifica]|uniref:4-diphosphocytidyl-2-C-methyl-D-erythritol kinase n=1 Tax=Echinicola pacifica TaxID=346377 RepID=A0A918PZL1_9BACT|nr:4-(cytidine 5'-diphospho)-2-C-methyl-D-erythritol kinase [Echinicola pacifica]GGZ28543.1 4-diphosphocytidyl-2-C-methyl-D-erythritol kinase [Echinicola pacifica]